MLHIALHVAVPVGVAVLLCRPRAVSAAFILVSTMVVDVDHLLADPIYDPQRCSIGFHPFHTTPALVVYALVFAATVFSAGHLRNQIGDTGTRVLHLVSLGLLIHMALDWGDCVL